MRILILGGDGMLGHQLLKQLSSRHDVRVTLRRDLENYSKHRLFNDKNAYAGIDLRDFSRVSKVCEDLGPEVVINAAGVLKQRQDASDVILNLEINSLLPHRLASLCHDLTARLVHLSTDCIFSGKKGNYCETDFSDAEDLYGRSKYLGEVHANNCLTLRTSMIGRELSRKTNLLEWFLSQQGVIKGYKNAIFSGFTSSELARIIENIITYFPNSSGLYHVSSDPISKLDLFLRLKTLLGLNVQIETEENVHCDRSLNSAKFRTEFNYTPPIWDDMLSELAAEINRIRP